MVGEAPCRSSGTSHRASAEPWSPAEIAFAEAAAAVAALHRPRRRDPATPGAAARGRRQRRRRADEPVGESPAMKRRSQAARAAARATSTVLITGESGTGKELVARAIHQHSARADGPFVAVNCGAMPRDAPRERAVRPRARRVHRRGQRDARAASSRRRRHAVPRRDRRAAAGAAGEAAARAPGARAFSALGATRAAAVDVRVVAATHRDLEAEVAGGRFREDLFYRLNVVRIEIPPLRERREDIPRWRRLLRARRAARRRDPGLDPGALARWRARVAGQRARAREHARARGRDERARRARRIERR